MYLIRSECLEAVEAQNSEPICGSGDKSFTLEPAHDPNHSFCGGSYHVCHVLSGQSERKPDPVSFLYAISRREIDEERRKALIGPVQCEDLRPFLGLMKPFAKIPDYFDGRLRAPLQHVKIRAFVHPKNAYLSHRSCAAGMARAVEGCSVATKEITRQ